MRSILRIISLALISAMLLGMVGCQEREKYENDILFTDDVPPTPEMSDRAEAVIFAMLRDYYISIVGEKVNENRLAELRALASRIRLAIEKTAVSPKGYSDLLDIVEAHRESIISAISEEDFSSLRGVYMDISSVLGSGYVSSVCFDLLLLYYEESYNKNMRNYEKYGYTYLLLDAEAARADGETLGDEIGRESFMLFAQDLIALAQLLTGEGTDFNAFSDSEMLLFIQNMEFSVNASAEGYEYLLFRLVPMIAYDRLGEVFNIAMENGDSALVSLRGNDILALISSMQDKLTPDDMIYLREGRLEMLTSLLFSRLSDEEWQTFDAICHCMKSVSDYEEYMVMTYGEEYVSYSEHIDPISLDRLREAAGGENFYLEIERYLGGISPAFSYGIRR